VQEATGYSVAMPDAADDVPPPPPSALEHCLDRLATLSAADSEPVVFFREFVRTILHSVPVEEVTAWLRVGTTDWMRLTSSRSAGEESLTTERVVEPPPWVRESFTTPMRIISESTPKRLAGPIRQAGESTGVLVFEFSSTTPDDTLAALAPFAAAVAELAGDFLATRELRTLRQDGLERQHFERWQGTLASATRLEQLAGIIAHDGRAFCHADRLTVLRLTTKGARAVAVSGVDTIDPRSPVVLAMEVFSSAARSETSPLALPSDELSAPLQDAWNQLVSAGGTRSAALGVIHDGNGQSVGVLIAERFTDSPYSDATGRLSRVITAVMPWWRSLEAAQCPWWWRAGLTRHYRLGRRAMIVGIFTLLLTGLGAIPIPFRITAEGELAPVHRRDLFATANGVVETVLVEHGDRVAAGQTLAQLRDPGMEMEATRVTGELATVRARLEVVEAARIVGATNIGETPARLQQLASEAADLRQQSESLAAQQKLLAAERETWTIRSPLDGEVLTWDVQSLLSGRPIERGQVLLTVGDTTGDWEVHARVRERDFRHLPRQQGGSIGERAEVVFAGDPGKSQTGQITRVSRVTDLNERGESTIRVTIELDQPRLPNSRAGTRVWLRMDCGRRALGYVWFHDFIDAIRTAVWLRR